MIDLRHRIWNQGRTLISLAQEIGAVNAHVHRVLTGKATPSVRMAKRIAEASRGAIQWREFFDDPPADPEAP